MSKTAIIICSRDHSSEPDLGILWNSCGLSRAEVEIHQIIGASSMGGGYNRGLMGCSQDREIDFFVFTHDDVTPLFGRHGWDSMLAELAKPEIGFAGVAGTTALGTQLVWWQSPRHLPGSRLAGAITHRLNGKEYILSFGPFEPVVVLDGVWLAIEARKLRQLGPWIEDGWHFYDIEMTLRSHRSGLKNLAINLPLLHTSEGSKGPEWERRRVKLSNALAGTLPAFIGQRF